MVNNSEKLERILEAIAGDIFNDIEYAKAIINEAGFDSTITSTEGERRIKQIQEDAFTKAEHPIEYIVRNYNVKSLDIFSSESMIYRIDEGDVESNSKVSGNELSFRITTFKPDGVKRNQPLFRPLDEERFQFN